MRDRVNVKIQGRVQGVFFRETVRRVAEQFDVHGFVRNVGHDVVEIEAEGEQDAVNAFIDEVLQHPPPHAQIDNVKRTQVDLREEPGFLVASSVR